MSLVDLSMVVLLTVFAGIEDPVLCENTPCASDDDCTAVAPDLCHPGRCDLEAGTCRCDKTPNCCIYQIHCQDQNPCDVDYCMDNECRHSRYQIVPGCCWVDPVTDPDTGLPWSSDEARQAAGDADCSSNICVTKNTCDLATNRCSVELIPECCIASEDCKSITVCTTRACVDNTCQYPLLHPNCCTKDGDCDDNDPCTEDICRYNRCQHRHSCPDAGTVLPDPTESRPELPVTEDAPSGETAEAFDSTDSTNEFVEPDSPDPVDASIYNDEATLDHAGPEVDRIPGDPTPVADSESDPQDDAAASQDTEKTIDSPGNSTGGCSMSGPGGLAPWLLPLATWIVTRRRRSPIRS